MKKAYIISIILTIVLLFTFSNIYAMENSTMSQDMKNMAGGVENVMQDVGNTVSQGAQNVGNGIENAGNKVMSSMGIDNSNYSATRTATTTDNTFLGMNSSMFTWVIMAIIGLAIIVLVWMYAREHDESYYNE